MGDAIRKAGVFLQDIRDVLRNRSNERTKCPRCRGSGLLNLYPNWRQGQPSPPNAPCLFCEGVGVMPIVGLRGYMIGRTDAVLRTKEIKTHFVILDNVELLHSGRLHGRNSTRFSTRRHFKIPSQVLYNPVSNPIWVLEAEIEAALIKSSLMEAMDHSDHRDCDDRLPIGLDIGLDHGRWRHRHRFYARTSASFTNPGSLRTDDLSPTVTLDSRIQEGQPADGPLHSLRRDLTEFKEAAHKAAHLGSLSRMYTSDVQETNMCMVSSKRGHRSSRRPRNRIREEAAKEAETRARKLQKLRTQGSANSWNPILIMCRSILRSRGHGAQKRLISRTQERPPLENIQFTEPLLSMI